METKSENKILEQAIKNFKVKKSFQKIKTETLVAFNEKNSIDIYKRSKQNLQTLRKRLGTLSETEIKLMHILLNKNYILHHTTRHSLIEKMQATGDVRLLDPAELGRKGQEVLKKSDFYGIENNIFFGFGTQNSTIPHFTRNQINPETKEREDYVTLQIDFNKLKSNQNPSLNALWSSSHWAHYSAQNNLMNLLKSDIIIGKTTISISYSQENALNAEEFRLIKIVTFKHEDGTTHEICYALGDEIALGKDFLPFFALSFIDRLRYLDKATRDHILENSDNQWLIDNTIEQLFRVDEFELHIPTELLMQPDCVRYITPQERKKITNAVATLAIEGNIEALEDLVRKGYPISGYMFVDPYHYDETPATQSPLAIAIAQKNKALFQWLISQNVAPEAFKSGQSLFGTRDLHNVIFIINILTATVKTNDLDFVRFVIDECELNINNYLDSKLFEIKTKTTDLLNICTNPFARLSIHKEQKFNTTNENNENQFIYKIEESDPIYLGLLTGTSEQSHLHIYHFVANKLHYCQNKSFKQRKAYDIFSCGGQNHLTLLTHTESNFISKEEQFKLAHQVNNHILIKFHGDSLTAEILLKILRGQLSESKLNYESIRLTLASLKEKDGDNYKSDQNILRALAIKIYPYHVEKRADVVATAKMIVDDFGFRADENFESCIEKRTNVINYLGYYACFDLAKEYIEAGAAFTFEEPIKRRSLDNTRNLIEHSLTNGSIKVTEFLLRKNAPLILSNKDIVWSMTFYSTAEGLEFAFQLLKDHPFFNMETLNKATLNPFIIALSKGKLDIAKVLRNYGAELPTSIPLYQFKCLFESNDTAIISWLEEEINQKYPLSDKIRLADQSLYEIERGDLDKVTLSTFKWLFKSGVTPSMLPGWEKFNKEDNSIISASEWLIKTLIASNTNPSFIFEIITEISNAVEMQQIIDEIAPFMLLNSFRYSDETACECYRKLQQYNPSAFSEKHKHALLRSAIRENASIFIAEFITQITDVGSVREYDEEEGIIHNNPLLFTAIQQGSIFTASVDPKIIELLLQHGANPLEQVTYFNEKTLANESCFLIDYVRTNKLEWVSLFEKYIPTEKPVNKTPQPEQPEASSLACPEQLHRSNFLSEQSRKLNPYNKLYKHKETGQFWQRIKCKDEHWAKAQILANKIYQLTGANVPDFHLYVSNKNHFHVAKLFDENCVPFVDVLKNSKSMTQQQRKELFEYFVVDAFIGNYNVIGIHFDNVVQKDNKCMRVNSSSCFMHKARGGINTFFSNKVTEIDFYLGKTPYKSKKHPVSSLQQVFESITEQELLAGMEKIILINKETLTDCVLRYGPGELKEREELVQLLLARQEDIQAKFDACHPSDSTMKT